MASIIAGPFMAALVVVWPRPNWTAAARAIDCHYQLQDRTETALDFAQKGMSAEKQLFAELQIADAVSRLESVEAQQVVPYSTPHYLPTAIGAAVLAFILALLPLKNDEAVAGPIQPDEQIVAQAEEIQENLKELEDELSQDIDPELEQLLQELKQKAEELKEPGVDVKEALAKISEMQAAIQSAQSQSSLEQVDQQLHEVGEAMASAKSLEGAGLALAEGKYDKAAKELENIENLEFDRNEARNTAEKLKKAARKSGNGSDGGVSDATAEMAEGIDDDDSDKVRRGAKKLGDRAKKQARRRKIDDLLKAEVASLNEGKDRVNKNSTDKYKKKEKSNNSSENWGMSESGNIDGDPTKLGASVNQEHVTGIASEGDSEIETSSSTEGRQESQRGYREVYQKYKKMSDAVLESENIPLGHRQTIRKYFESIRPQQDDSSSSGSSDVK